MSWIFGILSRSISPERILRCSTIHPQQLATVSIEGLYIAFGGIPGTCATGTHSVDNGWGIVGLGLTRVNDRTRILSPAEWESLLSNPAPRLQHLDGHFAALRWSPDNVECFTDQLGLRTLYVSRQEREVCFSTRLDWLARYTGKREIDFAAFGSRWLTFNQLSGKSTVHGIEKLGAGGRARLSHDSISIKDTRWLPGGQTASRSEAIALLKGFARPVPPDGTTVSLGLSGGIDSRTLLSLLQQEPRFPYSVHTFGHQGDPDVRISADIARKLGIERSYLSEPLPSPDECIGLMRDFVGQTQLVEPASSIVRLRYYSLLRGQGKFMLDGGFGEIARRQYLNRLLLRGTSALQTHDADSIYPLLHVNRGSFFNPGVTSLMKRGTVRQIDEALRAMPDIKQYGPEDFVDLFAVRTRFPHYGGPEQARLDCEVMNYMPFAQPSFLNTMFGLPLSLRRNGRLCRDIIRQSSPALAGFPLVKGGTTYPFMLSTIPAILFTRIKRRMGMGFVDRTADEYLHHVKEFVLDTVHSESVKAYPAYDYKKVRELVEGYYLKQQPVGQYVDWWFSFELWRESLCA